MCRPVFFIVIFDKCYLLLLSFLCFGVFFPTCMSVHNMHVSYPWKSDEAIGCPGAGITDDYEMKCGRWELNPGLLEEYYVLTTAELSLQFSKCYLVSLVLPLPLLPTIHHINF